MLFSSLVFILGFLPLVFLISFWLVKNNRKDYAVNFLILSSLLFYGWYWPENVLILIFSITVNFVLSAHIKKHKCRFSLAAGIIFNLSMLAWFKYANFISDNISSLLNVPIDLGHIVLPLAISFFTFQQIAYLVDIYRDKADVPSLNLYAFFVSFFPQLIAGPIVHHKTLIPQLKQSMFLSFDPHQILSGLMLFSIGLSKKVLIADQISPVAESLFAQSALDFHLSALEAWVGAMAYGFQIYFLWKKTEDK